MANDDVRFRWSVGRIRGKKKRAGRDEKPSRSVIHTSARLNWEWTFTLNRGVVEGVCV